MAQLDGGDGVYVWRDGETGLGYALAELSGVARSLSHSSVVWVGVLGSVIAAPVMAGIGELSFLSS